MSYLEVHSTKTNLWTFILQQACILQWTEKCMVDFLIAETYQSLNIQQILSCTIVILAENTNSKGWLVPQLNLFYPVTQPTHFLRWWYVCETDSFRG